MLILLLSGDIFAMYIIMPGYTQNLLRVTSRVSRWRVPIRSNVDIKRETLVGSINPATRGISDGVITMLLKSVPVIIIVERSCNKHAHIHYHKAILTRDVNC